MISITQNLSVRQRKAPSVNPDYLPRDSVLGRRACADALEMFRRGLDTVDIAWRLECTEAAAASGIAAAREWERASA